MVNEPLVDVWHDGARDLFLIKIQVDSEFDLTQIFKDEFWEKVDSLQMSALGY